MLASSRGMTCGLRPCAAVFSGVEEGAIEQMRWTSAGRMRGRLSVIGGQRYYLGLSY